MRAVLVLSLLASALLIPAGHAVERSSQSEQRQPQEMRMITVHNVTPQTVMWWLDPKHNAEPEEITQSRKNAALTDDTTETNNSSTGSSNAEPPATPRFKLPPGVTSLAPMKGQNQLRVTGTAAGIKSLESIIAFFDQPRKQARIETRIVKVALSDLQSVVTNSDTMLHNVQSGDAAQGYVQNDIDNQLANLLRQNKVEVTSLPALTLANNLTAILEDTEEKAVGPDALKVQEEEGLAVPTAPTTQNGMSSDLSVISHTISTITPTINNTHTVTVILKSKKTIQVVAHAGQRKEAVLRQKTSRFISGPEVEIQNNDAIALLEPSPALLNTATSKDATPASTLVTVILLKAHIVGEE